MSLLLPDSGLLFWMFLSFGIVFVILAKYGFPVIIKMVEGRKTYIDQSLEVAREANAQLSKLKEEGDALVAAANKEQGRILREAMEERDKIVHFCQRQDRTSLHIERKYVEDICLHLFSSSFKSFSGPEVIPIFTAVFRQINTDVLFFRLRMKYRTHQ